MLTFTNSRHNCSHMEFTYCTAITCGKGDGHITFQNSRQFYTCLDDTIRLHNAVDSLLKPNFHSWI